jgi:hypothetical protein
VHAAQVALRRVERDQRDIASLRAQQQHGGVDGARAARQLRGGVLAGEAPRAWLRTFPLQEVARGWLGAVRMEAGGEEGGVHEHAEPGDYISGEGLPGWIWDDDDGNGMNSGRKQDARK